MQRKLNQLICRIEQFPIWWIGILILGITFIPYLYLQEGSVFDIHDQLDETILSYVLNARYLGQNIEVFQEMLCGINKTGLQPSAVLFVPLYRIFSMFTAFMIQYAIVALSGYIGMFLSVKRVIGSNIIAVSVATCFCLLPLQPIYGLSCMGVPLLFYGFLCLYDRKNILLSYGIILFFGLSTHLVLIGYVVLGLWFCYLVYAVWRKQANLHLFCGFAALAVAYLATNFQMVLEFLLGKSAYISHREEMVYEALDFGTTLTDMFINSGPHATSYHKYLILPILCLLIIFGVLYKKLDVAARKRYTAAVVGFALLFVIALFYAFMKIEPVMDWRNAQQGFWSYFQIERFYWMYPAGWYMEFALVFSLWWGKLDEKRENSGFWHSPACKVFCLSLILIPTLLLITKNSIFYKNIVQISKEPYTNGSLSWEGYYAEDLMDKLENAIGRDMSTYRIAHLGISPAPALVHGFYTVDGYSNNYPLEYKHAFRKVIAAEVEKNAEVSSYFDMWGSRCYLFNSQTGTYYYISKGMNIVFENLEFDMNALKELGCEYLFSGGEILDAEAMGLKLIGYYQTDESYWGIWLYQLL